MVQVLRSYFFSLILCTALLCSMAEAHAAASLQGLSEQAAKAEAASLLQQGKFMEAYAEYTQLLRQYPADPEVNLGLARSAVGSQRLNQAIMAYERVLEVFPAEATLYDELAQVYVVLGDTTNALLAMEQKQARAGTDPAADAAKIKAWSNQVSRHQLHGNVRLGAMYDSNANQGPASNKMMLGNWNIEFPNAKHIESFAGYAGAMLDYSWRMGQNSPWYIVSDLQIFSRGNTSNKLRHSSTRSSLWARGAAGLRRLGQRSLWDIRVKAEAFDYELYSHIWSTGPELMYAYAVSPKVQVIARGGIDKRDYARDRTKNGLYSNAGLYGRFFFGSNSQHEFMLGGKYTNGMAKINDYSSHGWEASANLMFRLPKGFEFGPFVAYGKDYYKGPATILDLEKREEERVRMGVSLNYNITAAWKIETSYQRIQNNSNSDIYKYNQDLVSVGIAWSF